MNIIILLFQIIILMPLLLAISDSRTIYISDNTSQCGTAMRSCMTLSQITNTSQSIRSDSEENLTLVFLPGQHQLNQSNFNVTGLQRVSMRASPSTKDSLKPSINCSMSSKFHFKYNSLVKINSLTFNGCLENEVHEVHDFKMEDCHLIGTKELNVIVQ